jgi:type VI secretion system secreted protein Hcp
MKISRWWIAIALLPLLFWPLHPAHTQAPSNVRMGSGMAGAGQSGIFYVIIRGTRQGIFKGELSGANHRDQLAGLRFSMQVSAARDTSSGQATGRHQYSTVMFTKEWGAASPQILSAMASNEVLQSVEFEFVRSNPLGQESIFETVKLTQASITGVRRYLGVPGDGDPVDPRPLEDISLTFRKIEVTNTEGRMTFTDDWNNP